MEPVNKKFAAKIIAEIACIVSGNWHITPMTKEQAIDKYKAALNLRYSHPKEKWLEVFPTPASLLQFAADVGPLSWPENCGQSPWEDAFSIGWTLKNGVSKTTRAFNRSRADEQWMKDSVEKHALYGLEII